MTSQDSSTISELNMELRKFNATMSDSRTEITKLQKIVSVCNA